MRDSPLKPDRDTAFDCNCLFILSLVAYKSLFNNGLYEVSAWLIIEIWQGTCSINAVNHLAEGAPLHVAVYHAKISPIGN